MSSTHREWIRPVVVGALATVIGGVVLALIFVPSGSGSNHSARSPATFLDYTNMLEARNLTKGGSFKADGLLVDPGDRVLFRARLRNLDDHDLTNVTIWPQLEPESFASVDLGASATDGVVTKWAKTAARLETDPSYDVGGASLDPSSYRLLDEHFNVIRQLPSDSNRYGGYSNLIKVGVLRRGATHYVTFAVTVGRARPSAGQLEGGEIMEVRDAALHVHHWRSDNIEARPGQTLDVGVRFHNGGESPVRRPFLRIRLTPSGATTFKRLTATITSDPPDLGPARSSPLTINFRGDRPGFLVYIAGSTVAYHCRNSSCSRYSKIRLPDGVLQGGITAAHSIGADHRGSVAPQSLMFVDFKLRVSG